MVSKNLIILVLVIIVLALGYYIFSNRTSAPVSTPAKMATTSVDNSKQDACAHHAEDFFNSYITDQAQRRVDIYLDHYNANLDSCFVLIKYPPTATENLFDAVTRKQYGAYMAGDPPQPLIECDMLGTSCTSQSEFDDFVNKYMLQ